MSGLGDGRLALMAAITRDFSKASFRPEQLFDAIARGLSGAFGDTCAVLILDAERKILDRVALHDPDPEIVRLSDEVAAEPLVVAHHPIPGRVLETGEPFVARLPPAALQPPHTTPAYAAFAAHIGLHSLMIVPLRGRNEITGLIVLTRHRATQRSFEASERELAVVLADHAALALDNARAYVAIETSRTEHDYFFETSPIAMYAFDIATHEILAANAAAVTMYGYSRDELIGMPISMLRAATAQPLDELLAELGNDLARRFGRHRRKDGTEFEIDVTSHVAPYRGKRARFAIVTDISELVTEKRERRRAESKFERLASAGVIGILVADFDGRIREVNDAVVQLLGYTREELLDPEFRWAMLPSPEWQAEHRAKLERLRTEGSEQAREREYVHRDGTRMVVLTGAAVLDGGEQIISFVLDLSNQKWATAAVEHLREARRSEAKYQVANHELEAFSYSVAHDLRSPLRAVNGFARLIEETYRDALAGEGLEWLGDITRNAGKMGHLIDALLSLSRISRGELRVQPVNLAALGREALRTLTVAEPTRTCRLEAADSVIAEMDPQLARAVIENLVGNAWKFTRKSPDAVITMGVRTDGPEPAYYVADNGAGFDMAYSNKLFVPFQRLHSARDYPGTGIGLATVQRIVQRHGGRVWAEGREGEGATFYFTVAGA